MLKVENNFVIHCGNDIINIDDIKSYKLVLPDKNILNLLEESVNGPNVSEPKITLSSIEPLDEQIVEQIIDALNKYWREIACYFPRPHENFDAAAESTFRVIDKYYSKYIYGITPDDFDISILWSLYNDEDRYRYSISSEEKVISLRKDV